MPQTELSMETHGEKYRGEGEGFREWGGRVASALKDDDDHFHALRDALIDQRILFGGRIQAGAGSPRRVTMLNCFVLPTILDSFVEGDNSIMDLAKKAARTMQMGGGVGYDFSPLRPRGSIIRSLGSQSSGPVAFMDIYNAVCKATASAGNRRGAQMAVLRVDHPDILEYVRAKQNETALTGFNLSIGASDEFMRAVALGSEFQLRWNGQDFSRVDARALWEEIMRSTWDWAEPGVLFIDTINRLNNLWYCEEIAASNPCGEQPLPPNGACLLGSVNLVKYVRRPAGIPNEGSWRSFRAFDFDLLWRDLSTMYRAMDNVLDESLYPLPEQAAEAMNKRRIGIGVTGLANAIESMGFPYGCDGFLRIQESIMSFIRDRVYTASAVRAGERGPFPLFRRDEYLGGEFVKTLPPAVRDLIAKNGTRNSHLLSIAPTGTISLCADNPSTGIEPVYGFEDEETGELLEGAARFKGKRKVNFRSGPRWVDVEDFGHRVFGVRGRCAQECTIDEHLNVLATAQRHVDSAVSKTTNIDARTPWEDFKGVYHKAWSLGCKGITTYTRGGRRAGIFSSSGGGATEGAACYFDPETGMRSCDG